MGGNDHWGSRRWKTKSSSTRWERFSTRYGKRTFWALVRIPARTRTHDALDALWVGIVRKKVNWILDLDIRSFFDKLQHDWLVKFVEHRIGDQRIVRLIQKWLKAGVLEQTQWSETKEGTPQGAVISPALASLYLHHVLDLWAEAWRKKQARGGASAVV
jgi:RNA-directed DNA polymerase